MNIRSLWNKASYTLAAIAIIYICVYSCFSIAIKVASPDTYHVTSLSDGWTDENGAPFELNTFHISNRSNPESQTITYILPVTNKDTALLFRARNMFTDIYVNGELVYKDNVEQSVIYGTSPGSRWHMIPLDSSEPTVTIQIKGTACYTDSDGLIDNIYAGTVRDVYRITTTSRLSGYILSVFLQITGLALMIAYAYVRKRFHIGRDLLYLGEAAFFSAQWSSAESMVWQLFFGYSEIFHLLGYLSLIVIPIPFGLLANYRFKKGAMKSYAGILSILSSINLLIFVPLHMFGILELHYSIKVTHVLIVAMLPVMVKLIFGYTNAKNGASNNKRPVYLALTIFILCIMTALVKYTFGIYNDYTVYIRVAIICFLFCLIVYQLNQVAELFAKGLKADMVHTMALTDYLTGLYNRTAFAEHKKMFYNNMVKMKEPFGIIQFDVNNLKLMNDNYGHEKGDELIKLTAKGLKESFAQLGRCYRMGGDEFLVVLTGDDPVADYHTGIQALHDYCTVINASSVFPFTMEIAHGFVLNKGVVIEDSIKEADSRMYVNKHELKHKHEV